MRRGVARLGARRADLWKTDLRRAKEEHVATVREGVFGPQGSMPGDRYFRKKLEGRQLMRWYFPSKFTFQDFRVDEYFEMQADRFKDRERHCAIPALMEVLEKVQDKPNREKLQNFFSTLDEETFLASPSIQDLYGVYRMVERERTLPFEPPREVFVEHSPLTGGAPPFHVVAPADDSAADDEDRTLSALLHRLYAKHGGPTSPASLLLKGKIGDCRSREQVREVLEDEAQKHGIVLPMEDCIVVWEGGSSAATANAASATGEGGGGVPTGAPPPPPPRKRRLVSYLAKPDFGSSKGDPEKAKKQAEKGDLEKAKRQVENGDPEKAKRQAEKSETPQQQAEKELKKFRTEGPRENREYVARRHRYIDPLFRRRRLKWLERQMDEKNKALEIKYNSYFAPHPDTQKEWPTNKGSVSVVYPSPYH